jgi:hypothetical protein
VDARKPLIVPAITYRLIVGKYRSLRLEVQQAHAGHVGITKLKKSSGYPPAKVGDNHDTEKG